MELLDKLEESVNTLASEVQSLRVENKMLKAKSVTRGIEDADTALLSTEISAKDEEISALLFEKKELKEEALQRVNKLLDTIQVRLAKSNN